MDREEPKQKLCNLHSLIINWWRITIGKGKILHDRGKKWKNVKFDFYIKFYKPTTNN